MLTPLRNCLMGCALLAPSLMPLATLASPDVPVFREFKFWMIGCDNTRSCVALTFPSDDQESQGFIRIERAAGGDANPQVTLAVYEEAAEGKSRLNLKIDGKPVAGVPTQTAITDDEVAFGFSIARMDQAHTTPFLEALRNGNRLTLSSSADTGQVFSLEGSAAALLFMDDVQGRVGTTTALARPGSRPASSVPPAKAPPEVAPLTVPEGTPVDTASATDLRERVADFCDPLETPHPSGLEPARVDPLGENELLVSVFCFARVYNMEHVYFIVSDDDASQAQNVEFPHPASEPGYDGSAPEYDTLTNGEFDAGTGLLSFHSRGASGAGDCGITGTYAWTGERFALVEFREMPHCRGLREQFWPVMWRATLR